MTHFNRKSKLLMLCVILGLFFILLGQSFLLIDMIPLAIVYTIIGILIATVPGIIVAIRALREELWK